ncbi:MAG: type II secretion system GspH family protein [Phycisphaerae bacterium]|nr:type II secretion system GspH family protein [Phycisphaerae bacterium]
MKSYENKTGLTLVEMLIVVAIVVILTTMVIGLAGRIDNQSKEQLTKNTIGIITAALRQFRDFKYRYEAPIYAEFDFPLDCNDFLQPAIEMTMGNALGATVVISGGTPDISYSGAEVLYVFLSQLPECRKTLDRIDESLITNLGFDKQPRRITITYPSGSTKEYPLLRVIDPWGTTLKYDYYDEVFLDPRSRRTFPLITSAGPDKKFGNTDDISSRK